MPLQRQVGKQGSHRLVAKERDEKLDGRQPVPDASWLRAAWERWSADAGMARTGRIRAVCDHTAPAACGGVILASVQVVPRRGLIHADRK